MAVISMLFESDSNTVPIRFLGCWHFNQKNIYQFMEKRKFCTLAIRIRTDAILEWDGNELDFQKGMMSFVPQNLEYSRRCSIDEFIAINFETYNYVLNKIIRFNPYKNNDFFKLFEKILKIFNSKTPGYMYRCTSVLCEILALLQANYGKDYDLVPPMISDAYEYMHNHYNENDCTVEKLAEISHISEVYFRKLFKSQFNVSPKKRINTLRLEYAARLLAQTNLSINEISERSGFNDPKYFATLFKSVYNTTPTKFRSEDALFNKIYTYK